MFSSQDKFSGKEKNYDQFLFKKHLKHYNFKLVKKGNSKQMIEFVSSNDFYMQIWLQHNCWISFNIIRNWYLKSIQKLSCTSPVMIKKGDVDHLIIQKSRHIGDGEDSTKSEY